MGTFNLDLSGLDSWTRHILCGRDENVTRVKCTAPQSLSEKKNLTDKCLVECYNYKPNYG